MLQKIFSILLDNENKGYGQALYSYESANLLHIIDYKSKIPLNSIQNLLQLIHDWLYVNDINKVNHLNLVVAADYKLLFEGLIQASTQVSNEKLFNNRIYAILRKIIDFFPPNAKGFYHIHFDKLRLILIINDSFYASINDLQIKYNLFDSIIFDVDYTNNLDNIFNNFSCIEKLLKPHALLLNSKNNSLKYDKNIFHVADCDGIINYCVYQYKPQTWKYSYYNDYYNKNDYKTAAVIGAGIAGANIAFRLNNLGIKTYIIDEHEIAGGASGNPIAILKPHASADDNINSQLNRTALHYANGFLNHYFNHQYWWKLDKIQEYFRHDINKISAIDNWLDVDKQNGMLNWHLGICIKPKLLIQNLLFNYSNFCKNLINIIEHAEIKHINFDKISKQWNLSISQYGINKNINTDLIVVCNSFKASSLINSIYHSHNMPYKLEEIVRLNKVHGQISGIPLEAFNHIPQHITSGKGYIVQDLYQNSHEKYAEKHIWAGATYEHVADISDTMTKEQAHKHNLELIEQIMPSIINHKIYSYHQNSLKHRKSTRAVCKNHLPIAGKIPYLENIYLISGLSSHGLSWSHVCADAVIANISHGIYPWSKALHKACSF